MARSPLHPQPNVLVKVTADPIGQQRRPRPAVGAQICKDRLNHAEICFLMWIHVADNWDNKAKTSDTSGRSVGLRLG